MSPPTPSTPGQLYPPKASITVDIDGLHLYYRIHGLAEPRDRPSIYHTGVSRLLDLFDAHGVRATFFAVGEDVAAPENAPILERLVASGHELASHSHTHPYDLTRLGPAAMEDELALAETAIARFRGSRPAGFRAPGYNSSGALRALLVKRGYLYDSSAFPCPWYLAARAAAIGLYALQGRRSQSLVGDLREAVLPTHPHLRDVHGGTLLELPITVASPLRLPFIGTSIAALGHTGLSLLLPTLAGASHINLELHAIDATDHVGDRIAPALRRQPDQRVPLQKKMALLNRVLSYLRGGWSFAPLEEVATALHPGARQ